MLGDEWWRFFICGCIGIATGIAFVYITQFYTSGAWRPVKEIADAISRQDSRWLSTLPGIGATTAEQIVISLKRKVTPFLVLSTPPAEGTPDAVVEKKASGRRKPAGEEQPAAPEALVTAADGRLIEDVYEALMGLGLNPVEARTKLDSLLTCGKPFRSLQEAITIIYAQKG